VFFVLLYLKEERMPDRKKILVVEDEPSYQNILKYYLEKNNLKVVQAWDGEEGVNSARKEKPDLIILDVNLPKFSGYQVCKKIRENKELKKIPIIFLTVRNKDEEKILGLELGGTVYLEKPFEPKELLLRINKFLEEN